MNLKILAIVGCTLQGAMPLDAAVWTVTKLADNVPGSLRDAVSMSAPGDFIEFNVSVPGTIVLSSSITIGKSLSVLGPGPSKLAVSGNFVDRVFVTSGTPVFIAGLTMRDGLVIGADGPDGQFGQNGGPGGNASGGAILNSGTLILSNCWVTGNTARGGRGGRGCDSAPALQPSSGGKGGTADSGAIEGFPVRAINCTFSTNMAIGGDGGAGGDNTSLAPWPGGNGGDGGAGSHGVTISDGLTNCTFSGNLALGGAGGAGGNATGVWVGGQGGAGGAGNCGAVEIAWLSSAYMISCTIVYNSAVGGAGGAGGNGVPPGKAGTDGVGNTGGICGYQAPFCLPNIGNTIAAENYASYMYSNLNVHINDLGFNYFGDSWDAGPCIGGLTRMGTIASPLHPQLKPLAQNGGGLPTHAPMQGSPVIDWGYSFGTTTDERRAPRPYGTAIGGSGGDGSDVGAFEFGSTPLGMSIGGRGGGMISWPASYGDFTLQSTSDPTEPGSWHDVPDIPTVVEDQFIVTFPATNRAEFFRLINH